MTPFQIVIPETLTAQKAELEATLAGIASEEAKLASQRKDIQTALQSISTAVAVLSGKLLPTSKAAPATTRKPMSEEAKARIGEGLRKYREAKKAAQIAAPAPQASATEPAEAPALVFAPEAPAPAPADAPVADTARKPGKDRKAARE